MADTQSALAIEAHYEKSRFFRVIHVDGAYGGPSPRGLINVAFYSERMPLPCQTTIPVTDGKPGSEQVVEAKRGLFREVEVNLVTDIAVAASIHAWLGARIKDTQAQLGLPDDALRKMIGP